MKKILTLSLLCSCIFSSFAQEDRFPRVLIDKFIPTKVVVADGYLQVHQPVAQAIGTCSKTTNMVLPDTHKYFDAYLSLAMTALVAKKPLRAHLGWPCEHTPNWPTIITMSLND